MTFFGRIMQRILQQELSRIITESKQRDASLMNYVATLAGMGRDPVLSAKKRDVAVKYSGTLWANGSSVAQALIKEVQKTELGTPLPSELLAKVKTQDERYLEMFKKLLDDCQAEAAFASDKLKKNQGTFGPDIDRLKILVDRIFAKFHEIAFLEKECTEDPFTIFRYHMASYFAERILSFWTIENNYGTKIPTGIELTSQKQQMVMNALHILQTEDLDVLDKEHPNFTKKYKKDVITAIEKLIKRNQDICKQHGIPYISTAVTAVSSFVSQAVFGAAPASAIVNTGMAFIGADVGLLDKCCKEALDEMEPLNVELVNIEEGKFAPLPS